MAVCSKNSKRSAQSDTGSFSYSKLSDKIFGCKVYKIGMREEVFSGDYVYWDVDSEDYQEAGINVNYIKVDDYDWNNEHKNEDHKDSRKDRERFRLSDKIRRILDLGD